MVSHLVCRGSLADVLTPTLPLLICSRCCSQNEHWNTINLIGSLSCLKPFNAFAFLVEKPPTKSSPCLQGPGWPDYCTLCQPPLVLLSLPSSPTLQSLQSLQSLQPQGLGRGFPSDPVSPEWLPSFRYGYVTGTIDALSHSWSKAVDLKVWFLTSSIDISWELVRNAFANPTPDTATQKLWGGVLQSVFYQVL